MSVKSLLQVILLLLIFLIVGGVYFFYFYSGNTTKLTLNEELIENVDQNLNKSILQNEEILDDIKIEDKEENKKVEDEIKGSGKLIENENQSNLIESGDAVENLTKEIEYITSNTNGDIFKILAQFGKTNIKNNDILDLKEVDGTISSLERSQIFITSDYAKYNYTNQNSKFYGNVVIKYENKIITCDDFDLNLSENIAVAYNNVIVKDDISVMKAQNIILNIITKDININSEEKVKIFKN